MLRRAWCLAPSATCEGQPRRGSPYSAAERRRVPGAGCEGPRVAGDRCETPVRVCSWLLIALLTCLVPGVSQAASRYDPALRFRVLTTPHFFVYYHQGEEAIARRFTVIAEQVHVELTLRLLVALRGRTHVILVDQHDRANGWATPLPYDTIELSVSPPAPRETLGNVADWLRLVFVHEYTHILHLDRSRGYATVFRYIFGRSPLAFPNIFLPPWQTEGLATYEESAVTGRGRIFAGDFANLVRQAAREGRAVPLDRATADVEDWPSGNTQYAYGGFFNQFLAGRYGSDTLGELASQTAGAFPYLPSPAFKKVYGKSLGKLWREFELDQADLAAITDRAAASTRATEGRRLTSQGFVVTGPRLVDTGQSGPTVLYSSRTGHDFPALMSVDVDGRTRRITSRNQGDQISIAAGAAVFDQQDLSRSVAIRSDLYLLDLASHHVERLTRNARLLDPAIRADGRALAAIALRNGTRTLVVFDLPDGAWPRDPARLRQALSTAPRVIQADPMLDYSSPRWSPDGRWLAVARTSRNGDSDIAVFDGRGALVSTLVSSSRARNVTPTWTPDGRTILFASDRPAASGPMPHPFNIFAIDVEEVNDSLQPGSLFQVTALPSGATYPDASPRGDLLVYVGYTAAGYDVFTRPIDRGAWTPVAARTPPGDISARPIADAQGSPPLDVPGSAYSPWHTLLPRSWFPTVESADGQLRIGAQTGGSDVLGRHVYSVSALVRVAGHPEAPGSPRYDWIGSYVYDRWLPAFFARASDRTHYLQDVLVNGTVVTADTRERNEEAGVFLPDVHARYAQSFTSSLTLQRETINFGGLARTERDRNGIRLAWAFDSAQTYAYSISPEQGATIGVTAEMVRQGLGAVANADAVTVDARGYVRLGSRHSILAVRTAFGAARGDSRAERVFYLGGSGPNADPVSFGSDALNLLRGFPQNVYWGDRLALLNLEYRVPLLRVQRGPGTFPVFLRTVHVTGFFDAGKTWLTRSPVRPAYSMSTGGEIAAALRLGYELPLLVAAGVAWPRPPGGQFSNPTGYARIGYSF
jgi:hypothetical protein